MSKDKFDGHGGSYLVDNKGVKTLVHRTEEAPAAKLAPHGHAKKHTSSKDEEKS